MATLLPLEKKKDQKPSKKSAATNQYFEFKLMRVAMQSYLDKDYLKASMLSWSFIEEFFLPKEIERIAEQQKLKLEKNILTDTRATQLLRYHYLISYDTELYEILKQAKKLRNALVHEIYKSGSIREIENKAKKSAKFNIFTALEHMLDRLDGKKPAPSLVLYSSGWNDFRTKMIERMESLRSSVMNNP